MPSPPPYQCASCRQRQRELDGYPRECPACGIAAQYFAGIDRWVHLDGSDHVRCWVELARGAA